MKQFTYLFFALLLIVACSNEEDDTPTVSQCATPTGLQTTSIDINEVTIAWSDTNVDETFSLEYGISGFNLGSGTTVTSPNVLTTLTGLNANTIYDVYVKAICSTSNESMTTGPVTFTTLPPAVVPQFLANLSDLNLFTGTLDNLSPSIYAFEYEPNTPLFSDNAHKQRLIFLPPGESMSYVDEVSVPDFPDNTLIAKTFFYYNDEQDQSAGKKIIETRIFIKMNGIWESGDYIWNNLQTDAVLDNTGGTVPVTYVDGDGTTQNVNYNIPNSQDCRTCHDNAGVTYPLGTEIRTLNHSNQLQDMIASNMLVNSPDPSTLAVLPNWLDDTNYTLEERARAYIEINCAHCHIDDGFCADQSTLRLGYEVPFAQTQIFERKDDIDARMGTYSNTDPRSMPFIGTTIVHPEGYNLVRGYLNSL